MQQGLGIAEEHCQIAEHSGGLWLTNLSEPRLEQMYFLCHPNMVHLKSVFPAASGQKTLAFRHYEAKSQVKLGNLFTDDYW